MTYILWGMRSAKEDMMCKVEELCFVVKSEMGRGGVAGKENEGNCEASPISNSTYVFSANTYNHNDDDETVGDEDKISDRNALSAVPILHAYIYC
jgi:hypothetical protein